MKYYENFDETQRIQEETISKLYSKEPVNGILLDKQQKQQLHTMLLLEQQNENLLAMVKSLEAEKELLLFSMSELDTTLELSTRTLDLSEKLNAAYEYIMKQQGFSFEEVEDLQ